MFTLVLVTRRNKYSLPLFVSRHEKDANYPFSISSFCLGFHISLTHGLVAETPEEINTSDNDSGERPVRKKLKETSITSAPPSFAEDHLIDPSANNEREGADSRPRSRGRKRSFDETQPEEEKGQNSEGRDVSSPRRKRSRDSNTENGGPTSPIEIEKRGDPNTPPKQPSGDAASREIMSPKKKRSRDQLDKDELQGKAAAKSMEEKVSAESLRDKGERDVKRHRDDSQERDSDSKVGLKRV